MLYMEKSPIILYSQGDSPSPLVKTGKVGKVYTGPLILPGQVTIPFTCSLLMHTLHVQHNEGMGTIKHFVQQTTVQ